MNMFGVTGYLKVGDIIHVDNPLMNVELSNYPVLEIQGSKAITKFRTFNTRIYNHKFVYEYNKRLSPVYNNIYTVVNE